MPRSAELLARNDSSPAAGARGWLFRGSGALRFALEALGSGARVPPRTLVEAPRHYGETIGAGYFQNLKSSPHISVRCVRSRTDRSHRKVWNSARLYLRQENGNGRYGSTCHEVPHRLLRWAYTHGCHTRTHGVIDTADVHFIVFSFQEYPMDLQLLPAMPVQRDTKRMALRVTNGGMLVATQAFKVKRGGLGSSS